MWPASRSTVSGVVPCFEKVGRPCCRKTGVARYSYWTTGYTTEELGSDLHLGQRFFRWGNPACGPGQRYRQAYALQAGPSVDQIPGGGRFSITVQIGPSAPHILLYNCTTSLFPTGKATRAFRWPRTPILHGVKERVGQYHYSYSGPSWPILYLYQSCFWPCKPPIFLELGGILPGE